MDATPSLHRHSAWVAVFGVLLLSLAVPYSLTGQERPVAVLGQPAAVTISNVPTDQNQPPAGMPAQGDKKVPEPRGDPEPLPSPKSVPTWNVPVPLTPPAVEPGEELMPINLPAALQLGNARALDIVIAEQQVRIAAAALLGTQVLWLPTLGMGTDYQAHTGPTQNADGSTINASKASMYTGLAPFAIFSLSDAIFEPLSQRQITRAQEANVQTATNDTLTDVAVAYFNAWEARAQLAGVRDVVARAAAVVQKTNGLVPGTVPEVELNRVKAAYYNFEQTEEVARQHWRLSSAEVARILRLKPTVILDPLEPPQLKITLVSPEKTPDELIPIALNTRPELTFTQAQVEAARYKLQQERYRPLVPNFVLRGGGTTPPYAMAVGAYGSGSGSTVGDMMARSDWDVEVIWELRNFGLGNAALIRGRQAELELVRAQDYRFRDLVAREVTDAWSDLRSAHRRLAESERELREADLSAAKNLQALGETKRLGAIIILVIRPLEVVASLQALTTAYYDYFGAISDYNRAQFRMYRALGSPAQQLYGRDGLAGPPISPSGTGPVQPCGAAANSPNPG
jgi:outer membrane protein TolC